MTTSSLLFRSLYRCKISTLFQTNSFFACLKPIVMATPATNYSTSSSGSSFLPSSDRFQTPNMLLTLTHISLQMPTCSTSSSPRPRRSASSTASQSTASGGARSCLEARPSVTLAKQHTTHVALSIFVNPAQFAPHEDLAQYPRTLPSDLKKLESLGPGAVSAVLVPSVSDMYPSGITLDVVEQRGTFVEIKGKSHQMEGITRPGFFRGVATVVSKLFNIIQPDAAFFGQKDIQQCMVIRTLIRDLHFPLHFHIAPTARDPTDGLALSSRNRYLTASQRPRATVLYRALSVARAAYDAGARNREEVLAPALAVVDEMAREVRELDEGWEVRLDYISLADPETLEEVQEVVEEGSGFILSGAVFVGGTRLIDNIVVGVEL
ncbi:Pantoate-beta-alanine ligase-domain-containing protein [Jimgerdemannia flammicorona]|uniref:Pantoate--beta-alanine ligase n=1 Tax=Jimgerdemannia flammicorona TaxID=994334 RepID=A0A433D053_9FUNG|nr:Pantoate-beta-alanine ligase-domain-containing protein [Jimgerdemannia flammicorona]